MRSATTALLFVASVVLSLTAGFDVGGYEDLEELTEWSDGDQYIKNMSARYLFVNENKDWAEALLFCYSMDMGLVSIDGLVEQTMLMDYLSMQDMRGCYATENGPYVWTSGRALDHRNGEWWWIKLRMTPIKYTNFYKGEPNRPGWEKCLNIFPKYNYEWADGNCRLKSCFVCEK